MTPSDFIALLPKFEQVDPDDIQRFLDRATPSFNVDVWGDLLSEGLANFVAHGMVEEGVRGVPEDAMILGQAGSQGAGSWRVQLYLTEVEALRTTVWGRKYCDLRDKVSIGVAVS